MRVTTLSILWGGTSEPLGGSVCWAYPPPRPLRWSRGPPPAPAYGWGFQLDDRAVFIFTMGHWVGWVWAAI